MRHLIIVQLIYKQYCLQLDIALWCKNQIEHSIWDESLLFCNCACSLEYSSFSTLAGLGYHSCGKLEVAFKASPSSQHQHCADEGQKDEKVLSAVSYIYIYIYKLYIYIYIYIHNKYIHTYNTFGADKFESALRRKKVNCLNFKKFFQLCVSLLEMISILFYSCSWLLSKF